MNKWEGGNALKIRASSKIHFLKRRNKILPTLKLMKQRNVFNLCHFSFGTCADKTRLSHDH